MCRPVPLRSIIALRPPSSPINLEYSPTLQCVRNTSFALTLGELQQNDSRYSFTTPASVRIRVRESDTAFVDLTFGVNVWDLLEGLSKAIFSPTCNLRDDSPTGALGDNLFFVGMNFVYCYRLDDQSLLIDHHGDSIVLGECCIWPRNGCISCALALAKRLDIKIVVC